MKKIISITLVISLFLLISSCATIFKGPSNNVDLNSNPQGAEVYVNGNYRGDTPIKLKLESKQTYTLEFKKEGYKTKTITITNHVGVGWIVLDVICGLIPVIIDAVTGSWYELDQKNVNAVLDKQ